MSRLSVVSWVTSTMVHVGTLALLGTLLTSVPVQHAEIAGSRVVISSSFATPPRQIPRPVQVEPLEIVPVETPQPNSQPSLSDVAVNASQSEVQEFTPEPPEPPPPAPRPLEFEELRSLPDLPPLPSAKRRLPRRLPAQFAAVVPPIRRAAPSPGPEFSRHVPRLDLSPLPESRPEPQLEPVKLPPIPRVHVAPPLLPVADAVEPLTPKEAPQTAGTTPAKPARPLSNPKPVYPPKAVRNKIEGVVTLRVTIGATGKVTRVTVAKSSGQSQLDVAARDAVIEWEFAPATRDGEPVEWTARLPVRFRL